MESFDNFALYFKFKSQIEQETNSTVDRYTLAQFLYGTYVFVYGYSFLYRKTNCLPAVQMIEILNFLSCCKEYEVNERKLFTDMCKKIALPMRTTNKICSNGTSYAKVFYS